MANAPIGLFLRFGDICPGEPGIVGRIFLTVLPLFGLGFFCGPILDLASSWQKMVPGGVVSVGSVTLALGVVMLTAFEDISISEAIHLCVITGKLSFRSQASSYFSILTQRENCILMDQERQLAMVI